MEMVEEVKNLLEEASELAHREVRDLRIRAALVGRIEEAISLLQGGQDGGQEASREGPQRLEDAFRRWNAHEAWVLQRLEEAVRALFGVYDKLRGLPKLARAVLSSRLDDLKSSLEAAPAPPGLSVEIDDDLVIYLHAGERIRPWYDHGVVARRILEVVLASSPTITVAGVLAAANAISRTGRALEEAAVRLLEEAERVGGWHEL